MYESTLDNIFRRLDYVPKNRYSVIIKNLNENEVAGFDCLRQEFVLNQNYVLNREIILHALEHEAIHLIQYEENSARYLRMHQMSGSDVYRRVFHDTLLNPIEFEARFFVSTKILTRIPTRLLWEGQDSVFESLVTNPALVKKLLHQYSKFGHVHEDRVPPRFFQEYLNWDVRTIDLYSPRVNVLYNILEVTLSTLRERYSLYSSIIDNLLS